MAELQPTCIVGTKTFCENSHVSFPMNYNPRASWVLKLGLFAFFNDGRLDYNPRASWVLKPVCFGFLGSGISLQPTCIVGTKTFLFHSDSFAPIDYNPRTSRVLKPLSIHSATPTQTTAHVHRGY